HDADLAEDRVAGRAGDHRQEIHRGVGDDLAQGVPIPLEARDRLLELLAGRGRLERWPVVVRPGGFEVVPIADVVEDVPLREPDVVEQVPGRVRGQVRERSIDRVGGEVGDRRLERQGGALRREELDQLAAHGIDLGHGRHSRRSRAVWYYPASRPAPDPRPRDPCEEVASTWPERPANGPAPAPPPG